MHCGRKFQLSSSQEAWNFQKVLLEKLKEQWRLPGQGVWEIRGPPRHFTHSKLMAWVAFDRGVRAVEDFGLTGPSEGWKVEREKIRADILSEGWSDEKQSFVQHFGANALDASLLLVPLTGFLPPDDPRVIGTVEAIRRELVENGLFLRYRTEETPDGLSGAEGTFLVCSFWLADALAMAGRR